MTTLFNTQSSNKALPFRPHDFLFRFRKLQKLCNKFDIDGILVICGLDSLENEQYSRLISWLFTGYAGSVVEDEIFLDSKFKEFIFLVYKDGAAAYVEPELFQTIEKYLIAIPNVKIYSPTSKEMENTDEVELHKIAQFYKMTRNLTSVGVCLGSQDNDKLTNIEKWPLLQAYALDDVGCGFFGLNHHAIDITREVVKLYDDYDKYSLFNVLSTSIKQMEHHVNSAFFTIDSTTINKRQKITETQMNDIMIQSFEFSIIKKPSVGEMHDLPKPRVLFGSNTNKPTKEVSSDTTFLQLAVSEKKAPLHFTLEYVEPLTKARVGRTYFTTLNEVTQVVMKERKDEDERLLGYDVQRIDNPHYNDEKLLLGYYAFVIRTFQSLLDHFASNIQDLSEEFATNKIIEEVSSVGLSKENIQVNLRCYDAIGRDIKPNLYQNSSDFVNSNFAILRIQLKNLKSLADGSDLGSILFAETFYVQSGVYHNLTRNIPYFRAFTIDPTSNDSIERVKDILISEELGKPQGSTYESVYFYIPSTETFVNSEIENPLLRIKLRLYENGIKVITESWGNLVFFYKDLEEVELHRKLHKPAIGFVFKNRPIMNCVSKPTYYLFLSGIAITDIFLKIDKVFAEKEIKCTFIDEVSQEFQSYRALTESDLLNLKNYKPEKIKGTQIMDQPTFVKFLEYQEIMKINGHKDLTFKVFYKLLEGSEQTKSNPEKKFEIYFINGPYCSGKTKFAKNLARAGKNVGYQVHIFQKSSKELIKMTNKSFVEDMLKFLTEKQVKPGDKILIVLPSILNTKLIVDNIMVMPAFTDFCQLRAIATKINMTNFYHNSHKEIAENFLTFCTAGYSQFIILDNYGAEEKEVDTLQSALRNLFAYSTIYRINSNIVQEGIATDILNSNAFESKMNKIERKRNIPFKTADKKYIYIPFKAPIVKNLLQNYLCKDVFLNSDGYFFENESAQGEKKTSSKVDDELNNLKALELIHRVNLELSKEVPFIYYVKGLVRFEESLESVHEIRVNSNLMEINQVPNVVGKVNKSEIKGFEKVEITYETFDPNDLGLLFYGENLTEESMKKLLAKVVRPTVIFQLKQKHKLLTVEDLSPEVIKQLEVQYRGFGLDNGEFFDGARFRDAEGNPLSQHPKLKEIIEMHLAEENANIGSSNRQIDKEWKMIEQMWE